MGSYIEAIISGIVQGLTEFLPISSSGHLAILHYYFGYKEPQVLFYIFLHIGTLFAILAYFWYDIIKVVTKEQRWLGLILIGSIPTAAIGFLFKDGFETLFADIKAIGLMLFITAGFLFLGENAAKKRNNVHHSSPGWIKALIIGFVQGVSIAPGISRSGSTIATALLLRLDRKEAIRFSFLLAIPAIIGALLFKLADTGSTVAITAPMLAGMCTAFVVGLAAIHILIKAVHTARLKLFAIYCLAAGTAVLWGALL